MKRIFFVITVVCVAILACNCVSFKTQTKSINNTDQIIGVWKFVSPTSPVVSREIVKIITKGYFVCIHISDNVITTSFGGSCSFDGETYIENILFGTQNRGDTGRTGTFKIKFEDKKMYLSGQVSGPNRVPFSEVWERVE